MRRIVLGLAVLSAVPVQALELRLCTFDNPFPPYTMPDGSGQAQELIRRAAKVVGLRVQPTYAPRRRCIALAEEGKIDAVVAAYTPERDRFLAYPVEHGEPDVTRSLALTRFMFYRLRGSSVQWDGHKLTGLTALPVGAQAGFVHADALRAMGLTVDDGARTSEQNLAKLTAGRLSAMVGSENDVGPTLDAAFKQRVEMLPLPFRSTPLYLAVSQTYFSANEAKVLRLWDAIRSERASPSYQDYLKSWH